MRRYVRRWMEHAAVRERFRTLYTAVLARSREGGRQADPLDPPAYVRLGAPASP